MAGIEQRLVRIIKQRKLRYFGHKRRHDTDSIEFAAMTGLTEKETGGGHGVHKDWLSNINEWTGLKGASLLRLADDREQWRCVVRWCSLPSPSEDDE